MVADLLSTPPSTVPPRSVNFVREMRNLGPDHPLEQTLRDAFKGQEQNRQSYRDGDITPLKFAHWDRVVIRGLMGARVSPRASPAFDEALIEEFSRTCRKELLPPIALEITVARDAWKNNRALSENEFLDLQHMVALPYVDVFVTDDSRMKNILNRAVPHLPFRTAEIIKKAEFDNRFLP